MIKGFIICYNKNFAIMHIIYDIDLFLVFLLHCIFIKEYVFVNKLSAI